MNLPSGVLGLRGLWGLMAQEGVGQGLLAQVGFWNVTRLMGSGPGQTTSFPTSIAVELIFDGGQERVMAPAQARGRKARRVTLTFFLPFLLPSLPLPLF